MFALVVYGQLILENVKPYNIDDDTLDQIFDFMVRDFSKFALQLYSKSSTTPEQMNYGLNMIRKPNVDNARYDRVWKNSVLALNGAYEMAL
jgi:acyl-CoA dehydrogenase